MTPDLFPETKLARRRPRVLMHVSDAGQVEHGRVADLGKPMCRMQCQRCKVETGWLVFDTVTEARRGIPCRACNVSTSTDMPHQVDGPAFGEYSRRQLQLAKSYGAIANLATVIKRLYDMKRPPAWLLQGLEGVETRIEGLPAELLAWSRTAPDAPADVATTARAAGADLFSTHPKAP